MEKRSAPFERQGIMDIMRRRRDPYGDQPFDPDAAEEEAEEAREE